MNDLQVIVSQQAGIINFNFDEIRENVTGLAAIYSETEVQDSTVVAAKGDVATLRKIQKAIDKKRIEVKKEFLKPCDAFEAKCKDLIAIIEKPIIDIDNQVKVFEEAKKAKKRRDIETLYLELVGDMQEYLPLIKIYDTRWENATVTIKSIRSAIEDVVSSTLLSVQTIKGMNSEIENSVLAQFKQDLSLANAIATINKYEQQKAEILAREEAKRKAEEERKIREEAEAEERRIRELEKERFAEEERVKKENEVATFEVEEDPDAMPFTTEKPFIVVEEEAFNTEVRKFEFVFLVTVDAEELDQIETFLDSIGVFYTRRDK